MIKELVKKIEGSAKRERVWSEHSPNTIVFRAQAQAEQQPLPEIERVERPIFPDTQTVAGRILRATFSVKKDEKDSFYKGLIGPIRKSQLPAKFISRALATRIRPIFLETTGSLQVRVDGKPLWNITENSIDIYEPNLDKAVLFTPQDVLIPQDINKLTEEVHDLLHVSFKFEEDIAEQQISSGINSGWFTLT